MDGHVNVIEHPVGIQADKENDAAHVTICPVPANPGTSASLTLVPLFFSVAGNPIENIEISTDDDSPIDKGLDVTVVPRPLIPGSNLQSK